MSHTSVEAGSASDPVTILTAENRELRAYLKAFCAATVDPDECGRDVGVHEANPFIEWEFGLVDEGTRPGRVITGGQVRRAMELVGYDKLKIEPASRTITDELTEARDLRREVAHLREEAASWRRVAERLEEEKRTPSPAAGPESVWRLSEGEHSQDFRLMLTRIIQRHSKGLDLAKTIEDARGLLARKGRMSPFRDEDANPEAADAPPSGRAGEEKPATWPASYQETFNAIAAATKIQGGHISVSVKDFYRALAYPDRPTPAPASAGAVPEGWRLVPERATPEMIHVMRYGTHDAKLIAIGQEPEPGVTPWPRFGERLAQEAYRDALAETPETPTAAPAHGIAEGHEIVRHLKCGTEYEVLHQGVELQVSVARGEPLELLEGTLEPDPVCWEGDKLVVYRGSDGKLWAREEGEFRDGRFETLTAAPPATPAEGRR